MLIDKARLRRKSVIDQDVSADDLVSEFESTLPNLGHLSLLLEEMPDELKTVLRSLTSGRIRHKLDGPTKRPRENHNMRLKRCLVLSTDDPVGDLRSYFANS